MHQLITHDMMGRRQVVDLHNCPLPDGTMAHKVNPNELFGVLKKYGVPGITPTMGGQQLLEVYAKFLLETRPNEAIAGRQPSELKP